MCVQDTKMRFFIIAALMLAMALAIPDRRSAPQGKPKVGAESQEQSSEGQESGEPENASAMTNKVNECRSILQQAGMLNLDESGKPTEGQTENETEQPKGMDEKKDDSKGGASSKRNSRRY